VRAGRACRAAGLNNKFVFYWGMHPGSKRYQNHRAPPPADPSANPAKTERLVALRLAAARLRLRDGETVRDVMPTAEEHEE
jgi:hypothetical protein